MLPPNVIIPFDGLNSAIPSGWTRDTRFDGRFPKGASSGIGDTGGSATHTHTSPAHSHTLPSHTHTGTTGAPTGGSMWAGSGSGNAIIGHVHTYTTGGSSGGTTNTTAVTYDTVSNDPPYYEVIFITTTSYKMIPQNGIVLRQSSRAGLTYHTASQNKYLKGASGGADAGASGGSTTNVHNITHTHTVNNHSHSGGSTGNATQQVNRTSTSSGAAVPAAHTHTFTVTNNSAPINSYSGSLTTTETVEPLHTKIRHYYANGGSALVGAGDIVMTTQASNPTGWITCDGNNGTPNLVDYYIKNVDADPSTGGSNTHTHAAQSHQHTSSSHVHSVSFGTYSSPLHQENTGGGSPMDTRDAHSHASANSDAATPMYDAANTTADSANNEPLYIKVRFIMATNAALGGGSASVIDHFI